MGKELKVTRGRLSFRMIVILTCDDAKHQLVLRGFAMAGLEQNYCLRGCREVLEAWLVVRQIPSLACAEVLDASSA